MIKQVTARNAKANAPLLDAMFRARKRLFKDRLDWAVTIDDAGREIDHYDTLPPIYLIAVGEDGQHRGSLRLLPTTGETMLRDHFTAAFDGTIIEAAMIWECTRFCVDSEAETPLSAREVLHVTAELLLGMCETGLENGLSQISGVFDGKTMEIYRRAGWAPDIIGQRGRGKKTTFLGMWDVTEEKAEQIRHRGGIEGAVMETSAS